MDTREFAKGTLLIVDDVPNNLKMLFTYLRDREFKIRIAQDGEDALEQIAYSKPDLVLLDVMMPKLDGFEVCRRLKANPETADIPVIFMTALTDTVDKVQGFEIGAVDYLTKPVQQEEVLARISAHLSLSKMKKLLEQQIQMREQDNQALEQRNRDLEAYAKIVARDLKKPLIRLSGLTKILLKDLSVSIENPEHLKFVHEIEQARRDMVGTIDDLLLLAEVRTQGGTMEELDMGEIIQRVKVRLLYLIDKYQGKLQIPEKWIKAWGYAPWIEKIWENFIVNALKNGGRPPRLELGATSDGNGFVKFWIKDNGPALNAEQRRIMFSALDIDQVQEGLGMSIVQRIVEQYGGRAGVESEAAIGNTFYFILPEVLDVEHKT
jgi:DNA-binding response OmpR family regulator